MSDHTQVPTWPGPGISELEEIAAAAAVAARVSTASWQRLREVLAPLASHSPETYAHSLRVGVYAGWIALREGRDAKLAFHGGCGHDVGKCEVSLTHLRTEKFTEADREAISHHPRAGYEILAPTHLFTALIAGTHHQFQENPYGIEVAEESPYVLDETSRASLHAVAELVAECDFFDALTTRRGDSGLIEDARNLDQVARVLSVRFPGSLRSAWLLAESLVH